MLLNESYQYPKGDTFNEKMIKGFEFESETRESQFKQAQTISYSNWIREAEKEIHTRKTSPRSRGEINPAKKLYLAHLYESQKRRKWLVRFPAQNLIEQSD